MSYLFSLVRFVARKPFLSVAVVALLTNALFFSAFDTTRPVKPDTSFYLAIAKHLNSGGGFVDPSNFWPTDPSVGRAPLWPYVMSWALKIFPAADENVVARLSGGGANILAALAFCFFGYAAFRSREIGMLCGMAYAVHPTALYLAELGLSEPIFMAISAAGVAVAILGPRYYPIAGLVLGAGVLVRSNFILFGPIVLCLYGAGCLYTRNVRTGHTMWLLLGFGLFCLAPALWVMRNAAVTGQFPLLSSVRGETFYGSHNDVVANDIENWGYWVFPDDIPGETKKRVLAQSMNEWELDAYYYSKGKDWVRAHPESMPRLVVGKLVRAFVPVPWVPDLAAFGAGLYRLVLYLAFILTAPVMFHRTRPIVRMILLSVFLVNLVTVLMFYGCARFSFTFEPFVALIPLAFLATRCKLSLGHADKLFKGVSGSMSSS